MTRILALGAIATALVLVTAPSALAHANLASSNPPENAVLDAAPPSVTLTFTEPPDPALSSIQILDASGTPVRSSDARVLDGDRSSLIVDLPAGLPDGSYTVAWRVVSITDGHLTGQAFAFGVGAPATPPVTGSGPPPSTPGPSPLSVVGKTTLYAGMSILLAAAVLVSTVFGGALPGGRRLLPIGAAMTLAGAVTTVIAQASTADVPLGTLLRSEAGVPAIRLWVAAGVAAMTAIAVAASNPNRLTSAALAAAAAAAMLVRAMEGHAATSVLQVLVQWVHLLGVGVWIGGLGLLTIRLAGTRSSAPIGEIRRYSTVAGWSLAAVAVTGTLRALNELGGFGRLRQLVDEAYGVTLLVKVALAGVVIALGALHRYRAIPRIERGQASGLAVTLRVEALLAVGVFALTGALTGLPPDASPAPAAAGASLVATGSDFATTVNVRLTITPGTVGPNTFRVSVLDFDTGEPVDAGRVSLRFEPRGRATVGQSTLELRRAGDAWQAEGSQLSLIGRWTIAVLVQLADSSVEIPLEVQPRIDERVSVSKAAGQPDLYTIALPTGDSFQAYTDPGATGSNQLHFTAFDPQGTELSLADAVFTATGPDGTPTTPDVTRFGPGHFVADIDLSPGGWTFDVVATTEAGGTLLATFDQRIG